MHHTLRFTLQQQHAVQASAGVVDAGLLCADAGRRVTDAGKAEQAKQQVTGNGLVQLNPFTYSPYLCLGFSCILLCDLAIVWHAALYSAHAECFSTFLPSTEPAEAPHGGCA